MHASLVACVIYLRVLHVSCSRRITTLRWSCRTWMKLWKVTKSFSPPNNLAWQERFCSETTTANGWKCKTSLVDFCSALWKALFCDAGVLFRSLHLCSLLFSFGLLSFAKLRYLMQFTCVVCAKKLFKNLFISRSLASMALVNFSISFFFVASFVATV